MDFWRAVELLSKRKWLILFSTLVTVILVYGATRLVGSSWLATVQFISKQSSPLTGSSFGAKGNDSPVADPLRETQAAKNQAGVFTALVKSERVVTRAFKTLKSDEVSLNLANTEFVSTGAHIFELQLKDTSLVRAEKTVNALADSFVTEYRSINAEQAQGVVSLLQDQLAAADKKLAATRNHYNNYRNQHELAGAVPTYVDLALGRLNMARQRKDEATTKLADAQARLQKKQTEFTLLPATVPMDTPIVQNPLADQLQDDLTQAELKVSSLQTRYTSGNAELKRAVAARDLLKQRLAAIQAKQAPARQEKANPTVQQEQQEISRLKQEVAGDRAEIAVANNNVSAAQNDIAHLKGLDSGLNVLMLEMNDATEERANLAARLNSAKMAVDVAQRDAPLVIIGRSNDYNPPVNTTAGRTVKLVLMGALCALLLTSGMVIALDSVDRRLKTVKEAERMLPGGVIAAIPQAFGAVTLASLPRVTEQHPFSLQAEAYRYLALNLLTAHQKTRSIMALSTKADQNSLDVVANLGITLAQAGKKVIIVDANVRTPRLHQVFGVDNHFGFTNLLHEGNLEALTEALCPTSVANLLILPSGPLMSNPWELFRSEHLKKVAVRLEEMADYVLYDTPSTLVFTDAFNLCPVVDAAFLCVRAMEPTSGAEQRVIDMLQRENVAVLGNVISDIPAADLESYSNYLQYYPANEAIGISSVSMRSIESDLRAGQLVEAPRKNSTFRVKDEDSAA